MTGIEISKSLFDVRQEAVTINALDDTFYVYLALNEKETNGGFEYDFCEFQTKEIDVSDVTKNPRKYFELAKIESEKPQTQDEKIAALEAEIAALKAELLERI